MSWKHRWISSAKAQCMLLLCLLSVCTTYCRDTRTSPSDISIKDGGVTQASNKSPKDTSPTSVSHDAVSQTSTGSPEPETVDIQPSHSTLFLTGSPSAQAGETTSLLSSPSSAVLPPLFTVLHSPEPIYSTFHENFQESISSVLTDSVAFVPGDSELTSTENVAIVTTTASESVSYSEIIHASSTSNFESVATTDVPAASASTSSSSVSSPIIPSKEPCASNETSSTSLTSSSTSSVPSNSSSASTSSPVGSSSRDTTPKDMSSTPGKPVNTTKLPTNSSNTPGEEDRLHKEQDEGALNIPAIIGIGFGSAATALVIVGLVLLLLKRKAYRRNKQDSSNFWDDNVTLSYINSHAEFPKDLDAEMMSLDDDSFLNSLDSMTFANLWAADTAKHTNF